MKILIMLFVFSTLISCQIAYIRRVHPAKVEKIIIIEPPPPIRRPPNPRPPHPKPIKPKPEKKVEDKHKKRQERPEIKRPKRPAINPSKGRKKVRTAYTR